MPEVPRDQTRTSAIGVRGVGQGLVGFGFIIAIGVAVRRLRVVRRSARAGCVLARGYELDRRGPDNFFPHPGFQLGHFSMARSI